MNITELNLKLKEEIKRILVIKDNPEYAHGLSPLALKVADISLDNLIQKLAKKLDRKPIKISKNTELEGTPKEIEHRVDMMLIELAKLARSRPFKKVTVILNKHETLIALTILSDVSLFLHH